MTDIDLSALAATRDGFQPRSRPAVASNSRGNSFRLERIGSSSSSMSARSTTSLYWPITVRQCGHRCYVDAEAQWPGRGT
jgi:hypothetical protein